MRSQADIPESAQSRVARIGRPTGAIGPVACDRWIGNPNPFFAQLQQLGLNFRAHPFPTDFRSRAMTFAFACSDVCADDGEGMQ